MKRIRAAAVQFEYSPNDKTADFRKIEDFVEKAAAENAAIIAFPECCITGCRWIRTRRPELYGPLTVPTGIEKDTR